MKLIRLHATLVVVCLMAIPYCAADDERDLWVKHEHPGGGHIFLPASFTVVAGASAASKQEESAGITSYKQPLLNAKGVYGGTFNSIIATRRWAEDEGGTLKQPVSSAPSKDISASLEAMKATGGDFEVTDGPRRFSLGVVSGERATLHFSSGRSRLEIFTFLQGRILYRLSATFTEASSPHWAPITEEIIKRWQPAAVAHKGLQPGEPVGTNGWQTVSLPSGEKFVLPEAWVIIGKNTNMEKARDAGVEVIDQNLLELRSSAEGKNSGMISIRSISSIDIKTGRAISFDDADVIDIHKTFCATLGSTVGPMNLRFIVGDPKRHSFRQGYAYVSEVKQFMKDIKIAALKGGIVSTVQNGRLYYFIIYLAPGSVPDFPEALKMILETSSFGTPTKD